MGGASGCGEQEAGVASGSGWNHQLFFFFLPTAQLFFSCFLPVPLFFVPFVPYLQEFSNSHGLLILLLMTLYEYLVC